MKILKGIQLLVTGFLLAVMMISCKKADSGFTEKVGESSALSIAAAANLRDVLEDLKQIYLSENPNKKVEITFGSSGLLMQQIINGAPFDLFLSADSSFPEKIKELDKAIGETKVYAYGKVTLWSSTQDVKKGLNILLDSKVKKIAIANPMLAPYGKNTVEMLQRSGIYSNIERKIVWAENISQAAQFASSGSADIGFIALSNAKNKEMMKRGNFYEFTDKECLPIAQSGILLKGKNKDEAQDFFDFITSESEKVKNTWREYGYETTIK